MRLATRFVLAFLLVAVAVREVKADQTLPQSQSIPLSVTDFNKVLVFDKFNPALGTLTGVSVTLNGHVDGTVKFENESNSPATISLHLQATIALNRPDASLIVTTIPVVENSYDVAAFDKVEDFGGASGRTFNNLTNDMTAQISLSSPGDLALFRGPGSISLPLSASGLSSATGSGNLVTLFLTSASASATLVYTYTVPQGTVIPEPPSLALAGCGGIVLLAALRRGRARAS